MKQLGMVLFTVTLTGWIWGACGGDEMKNECNEAAAVMATTVDAYCTGRADDCWACDCYNQGMIAVETGTASPMTYECQLSPQVCDATNMGLAETCLADEAQCATDAEAQMTGLCDMTPK